MCRVTRLLAGPAWAGAQPSLASARRRWGLHGREEVADPIVATDLVEEHLDALGGISTREHEPVVGEYLVRHPVFS